MTNQYREDEILEMLPEFALGTLDPDEMLAVEAYMRTQGTPQLQARLQELEDSAALMAFQAPAKPLPPHIKGQLFNAIRQEIAESTAVATPVAPSVPVAVPPRRASAPPAAMPAPSRTWMDIVGMFFRPMAWAAVGAVVAFFILQPIGRASQSELATANATVEQLETELTALREENGQLQQINRTLESQMTNSDQQLAVLASPAHTIELEGQDAAPDASGALYVGHDESVLVLSGLDILPDEQTYQLWLIPADGAPLPSGLLTVDADNVDSLTLTLPDDAANYAAIGVSIEPSGGSPSPTGPIVLVGLTSS